MVMEHALLPIAPGHEEEFELAFAEARNIIAASPGCRGVTLSRSIESPSDYLLLVEWDSVEAHMVGFRESEAFGRWRALLQPHYARMPVVEHFAAVASVA